jgi:hypothetical protein
MSPPAARSPIVALVVGINRYANSAVVPPLYGCRNDADAVVQFIRQRFDAPAETICLLRDSEATHQAIKERFRKHLIDAAQAWHDAGKPDPAPAFLFHFSGHGSQAADPTGTKPNGLDETIVPYDSRTPGVFDIKDWELGLLLEELGHFTENVTVILDCCHSGSGTRAPEATLVAARRCPTDLRPQPTGRPTTPASSRSLASASGWAQSDKYVLLAACQDRELANEYRVQQGSNLLDHGALTYFLLQELGKPAGGRRWTYRELHEHVASSVKRIYPDQTPQCEGDRDRELFGGLRPRRDPFLTVIRHAQGYVWVDGGVAHQLTEGSLLHVYPPETRTLADAGPPIATLEVEEVGAVESGCRVAPGQSSPPLHARVVIDRLNNGDFQRTAVLEGSGPAITTLQNTLKDATIAPYVRILPGGSPADFRVSLRDNQFEVQDGSGRLLIAPIPATAPTRVAEDLCHLVRYRNALHLQNNAPHSELLGAVELRVRRLDFSGEQQTPVAVPIAPTAGGEIQVEVGQAIVLEITNNSSVPLYLGVLDFSYDWSISLLYPRQGEQQALDPGQALRLGLSRVRKEQIAGWLPDDLAEVQQVVKVIASVQPASYEILCQGALDLPTTQRRQIRSLPGTSSPLDQLLNMASQGGRQRALGPPPATTADEWTTTQTEFTLVRRLDEASVSRSLVGGQATTLPGYPLQIEAPAGFTGAVRILTERQATRAAPGDQAGSNIPPGLAQFPELFQPVRLLPTRAVCPPGAEIEIDADASSRDLISDRTPLTIELPPTLQQDSAGVLAVASDGTLFYPVGGARPGEPVAVRWLPIPGENEHPRRTTRALGRTIKLYLFKLLGLPTPSLGLHHARFIPQDQRTQIPATAEERVHPVVGGEVRSKRVVHGDIRAGQWVALIVHGFQSDTYWMAAQLSPVLAVARPAYDHVLTFDYESFNTRIRDNAQILATTLTQLGFGPEDGISVDVFAHSMGGVVTRYLVDVFGGEKYIDRCFLAGTPNQGTVLANSKRLVPWLGALLLNTAFGPVPALLGAWALRRISDDGVGAEDLCPGSDSLRALNSLTEPARVPYFLLAGNYKIPADARGWWQRLWQKFRQGMDSALDFVFEDNHDLVVNVTSVQTLREGRYPADLLTRAVVPCAHSEYFTTPLGVEQLTNWLQPSPK